MCSGPLIPPERWVLSIVQWDPHPWLCLIDEVYLVSSGPLIPSERWGSPSVQWAPHPWHCLRDEVYPVCNGPLIPYWPWKMKFTQCAFSPSSILRMRSSQSAVGPSSLLTDEVYLVLIPSMRWGFSQCAASPHPSWRWSLAGSVQWALIHNWAWKMRFTQCVASLSLSHGGVYTERGGLPSVQWALHSSWERKITQCAVGPSSLLREEVY